MKPDRRSLPPTERQRVARNRNWRVFKLRGLWASCGLLAEPYRTAARRAIDDDLLASGAVPQGLREIHGRMNHILAAMSDGATIEEIAETYIPF